MPSFNCISQSLVRVKSTLGLNSSIECAQLHSLSILHRPTANQGHFFVL
uniref:Uncharacterized protein n=1 Tax=Cryptosporidium parvum TaxID=5807 RepID=F0X6H8_CRYPV